MIELETISVSRKKFCDVMDKESLGLFSCKDLFTFLSPDEKNFGLIASLILNKKEKKAFAYQARLLRKLAQMQDVALRNKLLEEKTGTTSLIEEVKKIGNTREDEVAFYAWILCAQHSGFERTLDEKLIDQLTKTNMLHLFSVFLTLEQCEEGISVFLKKLSPLDSQKTIASMNSQKRLTLIEVITVFIERLSNSHESHKLFDLVKKHLKSDSGIAALILTSIIKTCTVSQKGNEIFEFIKESLAQNSKKFQKIALLTALAKFIKMPVAPQKTNEIFELIKAYLHHGSGKVQSVAFVVLNKFIETPAISAAKANEIFELIKAYLHHGSEKVQSVAFVALNKFIETPEMSSDKADEIFSLIKKGLVQDLKKHEKILLWKTFIKFIETPEMSSNKADEIFELIKESLTPNLDIEKLRLNSDITAMVLIAFIKADTAFQKTDEIFSFIETLFNDEPEEVTQDSALSVLEKFIEIPTASQKTNEMFDLIMRALRYNLYLNTKEAQLLSIFVAKFAASHTMDRIFDFIIESLAQPVGKPRMTQRLLSISAFHILTDFMERFVVSIEVNKIWDLIIKSLDAEPFIGPYVLMAFMRTPSASDRIDDVFDLIIKKVDAGRMMTEWLQVLAVFIAMPFASDTAEKIFNLITKGLYQNNIDVKLAALNALTACIKNKIPVTLDMYNKGLKTVYAVMSDADEINSNIVLKASLNALTLFIKYYSPAGIDYTTATTEAEKISYFLSLLSPMLIDQQGIVLSVEGIPQNLKGALYELIQNRTGKQKIELFKDITILIAKAENVVQINDLFDICCSNLNVFDVHKNPMLDKILGIENTKHWSSTVEEIQDIALSTLFKEVEAKSDVSEKVKVLNLAKTRPLFKECSRNTIFGKSEKTAAIIKIDEKLTEIKDLESIKMNAAPILR